jgi:NosR/NirI family transcriptional regulator, nitrous oxide reductase regulator
MFSPSCGGSRPRSLWPLLLLLVAFASSALIAQYQKAPPDFGGSYSFPTPTHPEPRSGIALAIDVAMLVAGLGLGAYLVLWRRSRTGVTALSVGAIAYFGFYRQGCTCAIGAIQNVTLSLVDSRYLISFGVLAFFFLPLVAAFLFGRVFCSGVCPLGAVQDVVLLKPRAVPEKIDRWLRWLPFVYLAAAIFFAGWGIPVVSATGKALSGRRFLICEWDPFISLFRVSGPFHMLAIGAAFIGVGMFYGRPYCRWLCPYGALLSIASRFSWKNVRITPDKELDCGLCQDACPFGAIHNMRADRAECVSCARCYEVCPREIERRGGEMPAAFLEWQAHQARALEGSGVQERPGQPPAGVVGA